MLKLLEKEREREKIIIEHILKNEVVKEISYNNNTILYLFSRSFVFS